jgi:hypothetical protein
MASLSKLPGITRLGGNLAEPAMGIPQPPPITAVPSRTITPTRRPTAMPRGPRWINIREKRLSRGGPGEPPPGFVTGTTSAVEWIWYWASWVYFNKGGDPRKPPYTGDLINFEFQIGETPNAPRAVGGSVSDFVYHMASGEVVIRLDTWYYHITADPAQVARDMYLKQRVHQLGVRVVTVYDTQFVHDASGSAAIAVLHDALLGKEIISPTRSGLAYSVRNEVTGQTPA